MSKNITWIVDFNYDANPECDANTVKALLNDELSGLPGSTLNGNRLTSSCADEALRIKLRFASNIDSIERV